MKRCISIIMIMLLVLASLSLNPETALATSKAPLASNIIVTNNLTGKADTVYVFGLDSGILVKVYNAATGGKVLAYGTVGKNKIDITLSITQLGTEDGSVYVSVSDGNTESSRIKASYDAEEKSIAPDGNNVTVTNNALGTSDTIVVSGLEAKSTVKAYNAAGKVLGTKISSSGADVTFKIAQLGSVKGSVYITLTSKGMLESEKTEVEYAAEPTSDAPIAENVTINNNANMSDTIYVSGLSAKDIVKVYALATGTKVLGTKTVASSGYDATVTVSQLGTAEGSVYISVTSSGYAESIRTTVEYDAEDQSVKPDSDYITVTNNSGQADTVYATGLATGDIIKVYNAASGGSQLGSGKVTGTTGAGTVTISQIGTGSGKIYVTVTSIGKKESKRETVSFKGEGQSSDISDRTVTVTNNVGKADTVYVTDVQGGDVVRVYDSDSGSTLLGSKTVASSAYTATITISQLGAEEGSIYVTVTHTGKSESGRVKVEYAAEGESTAPDDDCISITNNAGESDTIYITKLSPSDLVKVYRTENSGTVLGSGTVAASKNDLTITISQLGTEGDSVYISVTSNECSESGRTKATYAKESETESITGNNISITNNVSIADEVYVTGLSAGTVVRVYSAETSGSLLGSATVSSSGTDVTVEIDQLGSAAGSVYITITQAGLQESNRIKADYIAEGTSTALNVNNIVVTNNVGSSDTVYVNNLEGSAVVRVYNAETQGKTLGTATVSSSGTEATVTISQLGTAAGSVYVSVTNSGYAESTRIKADYKAESISGALDSTNITITNNASKSDTIYLTRMSAGDLVKVYDAQAGGTLLGSATVEDDATDVTVSISQLGTVAGTVYISVTSPAETESSRIAVAYAAETSSNTLVPDQIVVTNNLAGTADTICVSDLSEDDIIKVYSAASQGNLLGSATVKSDEVSATVSVSQLGTAAGSVYVSLTSSGKKESSRIESLYSAEGKSTAPISIKVTNNAGASDTVYVKDVTAGDVIKVYDAAKGGNLLGSETVSTYNSNATVTISQLGTTAGSVYVTVTSTNKAESDRTAASYEAEPKSTAPINITVINNAGEADTVTVTGLTASDVVNVYDSETGGNTLGTATVSDSGTEVTINISQLGTSTGNIYVAVTSTNKQESERTKVSYSTEDKSTAPGSSNITVNNNAGASDEVRVTGLTSGDKVSVYDAESGGNTLGTGTVSTYASEVTISISQIGTGAGSVYITVTSTNKLESVRTKADYVKEPTSASVDSSKITVTNNAGTSDTVVVTGLTPDDLVQVYSAATGGTLLGYETVASSSTEVTVTISQISSSAGSVYITVTSTNKAESLRTPATYDAEAQSVAPDVSDVTIVNNSGIASTVTVGDLKDDDIVKVYSAASGGTLLGSGIVETYNSEVEISVSQLSSSGGTVYISVTSTDKLESKRTAVSYTAKVTSAAPEASSITVENNYGIADTINVTSLSSGTVVKAYSAASGGTVLGTATVSLGNTEATISITQLGTSGGNVYVTITSTGKTESNRTTVSYSAESASDALEAGNITVVNNSGKSDTITVTGLDADDIIKVYNAASGGSKLATATVGNDSLSTTINISQLGTVPGSIYVSVTRSGKSESSRTEVPFGAESTAPTAANITIVNNAGISDTITVSGLQENDVINAYDAASNGNLLGSATVSSGSSKATITVSQLTKTAGYVYISATNYGKAESSLTKASYIAEQSTTAPYIGDIYVVNNVDIDDTITVYNLSGGDVVMVYDASTEGNLLGYSTVATNKTETTVSVEDLGSNAGVVYISLTTKGKSESSRTSASYVAESKSTAPYSGDIYVTNNVTISDTILASGLTAGDKIKVYNASTGGDLLGYATVSTNSTQVTISISQLGTAAGSIYVSVTSKGKTESNRTEAEYVSEQTTNEPYIGYITVVNNAVGTSDTITITQLTSGDIIKVYDASSGGTLLGTSTVATGSTTGTVTISQLGTSAGSVYVTVTSSGKAESNRAKVDYISE